MILLSFDHILKIEGREDKAFHCCPWFNTPYRCIHTYSQAFLPRCCRLHLLHRRMAKRKGKAFQNVATKDTTEWDTRKLEYSGVHRVSTSVKVSRISVLCHTLHLAHSKISFQRKRGFAYKPAVQQHAHNTVHLIHSVASTCREMGATQMTSKKRITSLALSITAGDK